MTYPGESVAIFAYDVGGVLWDLADDILYRAGSRTFTTGDQWKIWADAAPSTLYLPSNTEPCVVTWVVEVLSGTGTLTATEGFDPDGGEETFTPTVGLGSVTVTGAGTYSFSSSTTGASVYDTAYDFSGKWMIELTGTGSVEVQQVKMSITPPGGAVGGWSDPLPSFAGAYNDPVRLWQDFPALDGSATAGTPSDAWDAAQGAVSDVAAPDSTYSLDNLGPNVFGQATVLFLGSSTWQADLVSSGGVIIFGGADWRQTYPIEGALTEGVDWWRPPTEVPGDYQQYVQTLGDGSLEWDGRTGEAVLYATSELEGFEATAYSEGVNGITLATIPGSPTLRTVTGADYTAPGTVIGTHLTTGDVATSFTLVDTGAQFIVVSRGYLFQSAPWPGWSPGLIGASESETANSTLDFPDLQYRVIRPAYRVWNPDAAVNFMRMMQRGDGLGMGSGRVFNQGTRQGSSKVFGTY